MNNTLLIEQPENRFAELMTAFSVDVMIATDPSLHIIEWNRSAENVYEKKRAEVLGKRLQEIIPSMQDPELALSAKEALKGRKSFLPSLKSVSYRQHAETHIIPLKENDTVFGILYLIHDVSHRNRAEEQLANLNQKLQIKLTQLEHTGQEFATLTWIISNNIKEPNRKIYTAIESLIQTEAPQMSNHGRGSFRKIQASLTRMNLLLEDIIALSQISNYEKTPQDIEVAPVLNDVIAQLQAKIKDRSAQIRKGELCTLKAHKSQVSQLLYHLVDNAIKFNDAKTPEIEVSCKPMLLVNSESAVVPPGHYMCLSVTDNGSGFDQNAIEKLFVPFVKINDGETKRSGSGVGLAIARKVMEAHDGFIEAESKTGETSFRCYFPV